MCGEIQDLTSLKIKLKKLEHGWKVRIRNHLAAVYFPELDKHCVANSALSMTIVRQMLDPREIAGMDFDDFLPEGDGSEPEPEGNSSAWRPSTRPPNPRWGAPFTEGRGFRGPDDGGQSSEHPGEYQAHGRY